MPKMTVDQALAMATKLHAEGRLADAETLYQKVLAIEPKNPDALNLMGVLESQTGHFEIAVDLHKQAIAGKPAAPHFHCNLGNALKALQRWDEAIAAYRQSLSLDERFAEAHYNLASALASLNRFDEAIAEYRRAIELRPRLFEAYLNLGSLLSQTGEAQAALVIYRKALELRPDSAEVYVNAANALSRMGRSNDAVEAYESALKINPNLPDVLSSLASILHSNGSYDSAVNTFEQALRFSPTNPDLHSNLGNTLNVMGRVDEAERLCRRAIELKPDLPEAWLNLGNSLGAQGRLQESLDAFAKAEELNPAFLSASSNRLYMMHLHSGYDAAKIYAEHAAWGERHGAPLRSRIVPLNVDRDPNRRLRIGYVSPDFIQHPVGRFMLPIVQRHDRSQFEIFCYAHVSRPDPATADFRRATDHWRDIVAVDDDRAAEMIRDDRIDILIDLAMHAAANRLLIFARKPAPVQATYLAYCSTTGLDTIDYRITDPYLDPPDTEEFYSERSIRLPNCYWCYRQWSDCPALVEPPSSGAGHVTFGCLNNVSKLTDASLSLWCDVLRAVPTSRMIIFAHEGLHRPRILHTVQSEGIDPQRIEFVPRMDLPGYYGTYNRIDLALDVTPYAGGTTTCDALWMGVPVVTLAGKTGVGRGGVSILSNLQLPHLIAHSREQYVQIAARWAGDLAGRTELRLGVRQRMQASPLMDEPRFVRDLEAIYRSMWQSYLERPVPAQP